MSETALVLSDGKPGHLNQSIALCRYLGLAYAVCEVGYARGGSKAASYACDWLRLRRPGLFQTAPLPPGRFRAVVATGSTTYYPAKVIGQQLQLPTVAVLNPSGYRLDFACIVCPDYGRLPGGDNVIPVPVNIAYVDTDVVAANVAEFTARHARTGDAWGVIIGGDNAVSTIDPGAIAAQLDQLLELAAGRAVWVTTSRRTSPEVEALVVARPFAYKQIFSQDSFNPIPTFLDRCDYIFVTSDSASMISESVTFGSAAVEVLLNRQHRRPNKFLNLIDNLQAVGAVHIFDGRLGTARHKIDLAAVLQRVREFI